MLITRRNRYGIDASEVTPEAVFRNRRQVLRDMGLLGVALLGAGCGDTADAKDETQAEGAKLDVASQREMAGGEKPTPEGDVRTYNNYYEFGTAKGDPSENAGTLKTRPWSVVVDGACDAPGTLDIDTLTRLFPLEERIYRHRCVEAWSIVVPWVGFPLGPLLERFKPNDKAKYVQFFTLFDKEQMPLWRWSGLELPYREGLRIDEALHPLAFVSLGMYGKVLPNQNGAPLRLTVPWKYGFKSIKSIVRISFVEEMPQTTWNMLQPSEYGFYSNVNPEVDHPRWSQASERRLGEFRRRKTLMFNGYEEVASLYEGMDLQKNY